MNVKDIIGKYETPFYVFDIDKLKERVNYLKKIFKNINIVYAVKANTFIPKEIKDDVERFEICSNGEFEICTSLNIDKKQMVISGVYKDYKSIEKMMKNYEIGRYTIESLNQFKLLEELADKYNKKIHVLIRLTSKNQFGITEDEMIYIIENSKNLIIEGVEYFSGTQKKSLKKIEREIEHLNNFIKKIEKEYKINLNEIEYGPGLSINYFKEDYFNEEEYLKEINKILKILSPKKIYLEVGRSIASSCGYYFTKIVDMKTNKNGNYVIVDGGINHLVYYGQTMAMRVPYYSVYPKRKGEVKTYNIYGSLCTVNDIIVKNINENNLKINDTFIFKNVGAYSSTEGISLFLSRDLPKVILKKGDKLKVVRESLKTSEINFPKY